MNTNRWLGRRGVMQYRDADLDEKLMTLHWLKVALGAKSAQEVDAEMKTRVNAAMLYNDMQERCDNNDYEDWVAETQELRHG